MFIGVYRASYAYSPQTDEELALQEGDLLYLLQKDDDGWWKVKRRVEGATSEEPEGIVPHNYIEPAPAVGTARALYAYAPQTDEELGFPEGQQFAVYAEDGDWVLVGLTPSNDKFGFVPANYISVSKGSTGSAPAAKSWPAPPQRTPEASPAPPVVTDAVVTDPDAPPRPARPQHTGSAGTSSNPDRNKRLPDSPPLDVGRSNSVRRNRSGSGTSRTSRSEPRQVSWDVLEVNGRKKVERTLFTSATEITLTGGSAGETSWVVPDLMSYSSEKKHVFLELQHPRASLDLRLASQDQADRLVAVLGQMAGASRGGGGLNEVIVAASSAGQKQGRVALDFQAANSKEVSVKEGDNVFVLNTSNKDWWVVRTSTGDEGLVPRTYIELEPESRNLASRLGLRRSQERQQKRERQEREKERDRVRRDREDEERSAPRRSRSVRSTASGNERRGKSLPDSRKVRQWVDRSGQFRVEAALLGISDGKIHLHKVNGVKIAVPAKKLSRSDLEYVESVTGVSLEDDKPLADSSGTRPSRSGSRSSRSGSVSRPAASSNPPPADGFDWFAFFLDCGVDVHNANRYAANFTRDRMDESVLEDISPSILRTLGLREGDILRVTKKLNEKYGRKPAGGLFGSQDGVLADNSGTQPAAAPIVAQPTQPPVQPQPTQSQPVQPVTPVQPVQPAQTQPVAPVVTGMQNLQLGTPTGPSGATGQRPTGALADLLGYPTLAPQKTAATPQPQPMASSTPALAPTQTGPPALIAQLTATQNKQQAQILRQQAEIQQQQIQLLKQQQEQLRKQQDELKRVQTGMRTGGPLGPFATGVAGLQASMTGAFGPANPASSVLAAQPVPPPSRQPGLVSSGFPLLGSQPTGPFAQTTGVQTGIQTGGQPTGVFASQPTGPFQSQSLPSQSLPSQATGPFKPATSFQSQATGPFQPTTSFQSQATGPFQSQATGPFQPATTFNSQPSATSFQTQATGPFQQTAPFQSQATGPFQSQPTGPFASQATGPFQTQSTPQPTSFQPFQTQATGPFQNQSFQPFQSQPQIQPFQNQATGPFQSQPAFQNQATGPFQSQPAPFQGQATGPFQNQPSGFQQSTFQPQSSFQPGLQSQASFQSQPNLLAGGSFQSGTGFQGVATGPFASQQFGTTQVGNTQIGNGPTTTFGNFSNGGIQQPQASMTQQRTGTLTFPGATGAFQTAPLQNQATGFGFGNQPQSQQQAKAPNLSMATASNPFGF